MKMVMVRLISLNFLQLWLIKWSINYNDKVIVFRDADTELGTLEAFRVFDKERTGFISKAELKNIIMNLGETMAEEEADELL